MTENTSAQEPAGGTARPPGHGHAAHAHTHAHGPTEDIQWGEETEWLDQAAAWWRPLDQEAADWLGVAAGSTAVDAGCGGGGMTVVLAERVGSGGRVYAVDGEPVLLAATRKRAAAHGADGWVETVEADLGADAAGLAAVAGRADLVWASHVVHHVPDQQAALTRLAGLLAPGGRLALAEGGLTMSNLPWDLGVGRPGLEGRLLAVQESWFTDMRASLPGVVRAPHGWPVLLRNAGLTEVTSKSFLLEKPAPLDDPSKPFVLHRLARMADRNGDRMPPDDRAAWNRLLDPQDKVWLGHREDLHALVVRTVQVGRRPA